MIVKGVRVGIVRAAGTFFFGNVSGKILKSSGLFRLREIFFRNFFCIIFFRFETVSSAKKSGMTCCPCPTPLCFAWRNIRAELRRRLHRKQRYFLPSGKGGSGRGNLLKFFPE